ncbi:uncharacterized protein LOC119178684 isoform X4 [Rhipicephalus microplus]
MRLKLKTLREPFPRTIDVDRHEVHPRKTEQNGQPKEPPHSVVEEQKTIIEKKDKEIKKLRKQLSEASSLNTRLTNVMLNKIEVAAVTAERQEGQVIAEFMLPSSLDAGTGLPVEMVEDVRDLDMDVEATCLLPSSGVSDFNASIGHDDNHFVHSHDSLSHCDEQQQPATAKPLASQARAMAPTAPTDLYRVFDGQVEIGQNTFMALEKWEHIMRNTSDGKFCLELARHFWPTAEAAKRSLTGQACRSLSTGIMKLQATPEKVEMMESKQLAHYRKHYCVAMHVVSLFNVSGTAGLTPAHRPPNLAQGTLRCALFAAFLAKTSRLVRRSHLVPTLSQHIHAL